MTGPFSVVLIVAALLLALFGAIWAVLDRPMTRPLIIAAGVVEVVAVVQTGIALAEMAGGHRTNGSLALMLPYLATLALLIPLGVLGGFIEPTRWGSASVAGCALFVPVLIARLQDLWSLHA